MVCTQLHSGGNAFDDGEMNRCSTHCSAHLGVGAGEAAEVHVVGQLGFARGALGRQNFKQESGVIKFSFRDQSGLRTGGGLVWRKG